MFVSQFPLSTKWSLSLVNRDWNPIVDVGGNGVIDFRSSLNWTRLSFSFRGRSWFLWFDTRNLRGYQVASSAYVPMFANSFSLISWNAKVLAKGQGNSSHRQIDWWLNFTFQPQSISAMWNMKEQVKFDHYPTHLKEFSSNGVTKHWLERSSRPPSTYFPSEMSKHAKQPSDTFACKTRLMVIDETGERGKKKSERKFVSGSFAFAMAPFHVFDSWE